MRGLKVGERWKIEQLQPQSQYFLIPEIVSSLSSWFIWPACERVWNSPSRVLRLKEQWNILCAPSTWLMQFACHKGPFLSTAKELSMEHKYHTMRISSLLTGYGPSPFRRFTKTSRLGHGGRLQGKSLGSATGWLSVWLPTSPSTDWRVQA